MPDVRKPSPSLKVMSAARPSARNQQSLKELIRAEATNLALNFTSIARENWEQLRGTDRVFKIKALIVGSWLAISVASLVVACPGTIRSRNSLGAQLVVSTVAEHPVYMIKNDGRSTWRRVVVVVNNKFRTAAPLVEPGNNLTFGPKQLVGEGGQTAPDDLEMSDLELRTSDGGAWLLQGGEVR